ncbi:MAG: 4a-hydroxytetrahydrobiopterin dehydratase [Anaerolineales bacterium]|nr:4a-hydroxytetrahydrobiopterin dehydratase [Anaerolineales bacterium]
MNTPTPLSQQSCVPCRGDEPTLTGPEIEAKLPMVPEWQIVSVGNVPRLRRSFRFDDFVSALAFTQQVGELAEAQGHHPVLRTEWGRVRVDWWTHKINGLHNNDFVMAAKTDELFGS